MPKPRQPDSQRDDRIQLAKRLREQGFSYPEIARELGISVGTAWNLINT